ncbi:prephenate dehydrogenase [Thermicanus aegyptius]|uniref:prephenate dehydrogenase n=1 Tax=Thermicanus aegyptius TaxID=94009 RepID=UPI0003F87610|nr:prephenate dehydrogenase [Thermicanus aegyptius]
MKKISVIGLGLIGGSLAVCLKKNPEAEVWGYDREERRLTKGLELGIIDRAAASLEEAVEGADLVVLATPIATIQELLKTLSGYSLKPGMIITDVGSTKSSIVSLASEVLSRHEVTFIGGHPMAGSHKSGVEAANPLLFENAFYVLSPTEKTPEEKVKELEELLAPTRAQFIYLDPKLHDQVVGMISHFPHLVAGLLVNQVERLHGENPWYHRLAAGGFKDITRIASSNPDLWRDVTLDNRENLLRIIDSWNRDMEVLKESLIQEDGERIRAFFERAALFRNGLPERNAGALRPLNDLYLDIPDRPGEIGKITTLIGEMGINLINIEILELREDIMGVLRLSFRNGADRDRVRDRLAKLGYTLYQRE